MAYITGIVLGWRLVRCIVLRPPVVATALQVDDFLTWATLGVVLGGRAGYVLFYQPAHFLEHPLEILELWTGGMSFHGGALGVTLAIVIFCRKYRLSILGFADRIAVAVPIGLGLGRVANFINGELWGRPAAAWFPWPMVYPEAGPVPRYPSELIEAATEGVLLLCVMLLAVRSPTLRAASGFLTGLFLCGYAAARIFSECFREPDVFLGFLSFGLTMGQILSLPMLAAGAGLMVWGATHRAVIADAA
jgi:phosphatidylglycerol:prolipoprotein diacylglycerol transferase